MDFSIALDIATVLIMYAMINIICAIFMAIMWRQNHRHFSGIGLWLTHMTLQVVGTLVVFLTGIVPVFISTSFSSIFIITGFFLIYIGLQRFIDKQISQIHNYILMGVFIVFHIYFHYSRLTPNIENIVFSVLSMTLTLQCAWLMLFGVPRDLRRSTRIVGIVFSGYAFVSLIRIIWLIMFSINSANYFETSTVDTLLIILYTMLSVGLVISLVLMVNSRLINEIKYMSFHDYLTGLYNRAFFEEELKRLDVGRNLPLSVVNGDVNGLKITNDLYGHEKGDELLVKVADILRESFRKSNIISRWGGYEFIILLPKTAYKRAEGSYAP